MDNVVTPGVPIASVPFETLVIGTEVISAIGNLGIISNLDAKDNNKIFIAWNSGKHSYVRHNRANYIRFAIREK